MTDSRLCRLPLQPVFVTIVQEIRNNESFILFSWRDEMKDSAIPSLTIFRRSYCFGQTLVKILAGVASLELTLYRGK